MQNDVHEAGTLSHAAETGTRGFGVSGYGMATQTASKATTTGFTAISGSILLTHFQFTGLAFNLNFGWPPGVKDMAGKIKSVLFMGFLDMLIPPECMIQSQKAALGDDPNSVSMAKLGGKFMGKVAVVVVYVFVFYLWYKMAKWCRCMHCKHRTINSMACMYCMTLMLISTSCFQMMMSTYTPDERPGNFPGTWSLDVMPTFKIKSSDLKNLTKANVSYILFFLGGFFLAIIFLIIIPIFLIRFMRKAQSPRAKLGW